MTTGQSKAGDLVWVDHKLRSRRTGMVAEFVRCRKYPSWNRKTRARKQSKTYWQKAATFLSEIHGGVWNADKVIAVVVLAAIAVVVVVLVLDVVVVVVGRLGLCRCRCHGNLNLFHGHAVHVHANS